jgi:predicted transcriptional regulator
MTDSVTAEQPNYLALTADVVSAYLANNSLRPGDIESLIKDVYTALTIVSGSASKEDAKQPAVNTKKSVTNDSIICLEDGKKFKSLRRHLAAVYNMTPDEYRVKWSLPLDYPMVSPNYSAARSALAKKSGLGNAAKNRRRLEAKPATARGRGLPRKDA